MKKILKKIPYVQNFLSNLDTTYIRDEFVKNKLENLAPNLSILDAGCGTQKYKKYCQHLIYKAQDFGAYKKDFNKYNFNEEEIEFQYGELDYIGDIWDIKEVDEKFDVILCTEVFEHIPYPIKTIKEFQRLLKKGGKLILTAPGNSLRHMDPYFFYPGFSDRFYERILSENNFEINEIISVGGYYGWMKVETARTMILGNYITKIFLFPALIYFHLKNENKNSKNALSQGYHLIATKL